jgi:XTP/dITP diphosphohydrolase
VNQLLVATTNAGKLREIREVLAGLDVGVLGLSDVSPTVEPEETGTTFQQNARIKALHYAAAAPMLTVAEDSGLVVDALNGEPGVHSARFLGADATYAERFAEIARRLAARPHEPRTARFVCALAAARDGAILFEATGTVEGEIISAPRGSNGFGYDPIFLYPPYAKTFGEVSQQAKLQVAHRGRAFRQLRTWLELAGRVFTQGGSSRPPNL